MPRPLKDLSGQRFGRLTAIRCSGRTAGKAKNALWEMRCDCGNLCNVSSANLGRRSQSCGCLQRELLSSQRKTHGLSKTRMYNVWRGMLKRCQLATNASYDNYGGRGIKVCRRWQKFENFWADMGATYRQGLSIERKNNARGYTPKNCIWANGFTQGNNRRTNVVIRTPWGRMTIAQAARKAGLRIDTLRHRLLAQWAPAKLFSSARTYGSTT